MRRQAEEGMAHVFRRHARGLQHLAYAVGQDRTHAVHPDLGVVGGAAHGFGEHLPGAIDDDEARLGAATVDAQEAACCHHGSNGYRRTPWTTRFTVPWRLGLSGDRPSAREHRKAKTWATATYG